MGVSKKIWGSQTFVESTKEFPLKSENITIKSIKYGHVQIWSHPNMVASKYGRTQIVSTSNMVTLKYGDTQIR